MADRRRTGRTIPGEIGWKPDAPDAGDAGGGGERPGPGGRSGAHEGPGLVLRVLSTVPFLVVGMVGVVALVGWALMFVVGYGEQEAVWTWAAGRPGGEVATQILVVVLLGLVCLAGTGLALWAAVHGFGAASGPRFWTASQVVFGAAAVGMLAADRARGDAVGGAIVGRTQWWITFAGVILSLVLFWLRARAVPASDDRDDRDDDGDAG
ncbi:MAG TPA: hypothetical protein PLB30_06230 [Thermoleophilia bacterium]|nr:hypothetical protein [Thermoleophilia bacterium]